MFDSGAWQEDFRQIALLESPYPYLSVLDFIAIENPRIVPQQSVTTVTNVDDIEAHVIKGEKLKKKEYFYAYDIPANERDTVMKDLRFMGITAGSLFPGIDGVCEELRERYFEK